MIGFNCNKAKKEVEEIIKKLEDYKFPEEWEGKVALIASKEAYVVKNLV